MTRSRQSAVTEEGTLVPHAPSFLLALFEAPRAFSEAGSLIPASRFLQGLPAGDGHAVMTLPGFMASDRSTRVLRRYLSAWDYDANPWDLGRNIGVNRNGDLDADLDQRLKTLFEQSGGKVSLVGWSLGGLLAREAARRNPELVRSVITLGSPLGDPKATSLWRVFEMMAGVRVTDEQVRRRIARLREPIPGVPTSAIYSRSDAIVSWQIAKLPSGPETESIGINGSHLGMGFNPAVLYAIADRLRQAPGDWRPFEISGVRSLFYH